MLFLVCGQSFFTIKSLRAELAGQRHRKMLSFNMSVKMRRFLVAVRAISALPNFVTAFILHFTHLAFDFEIIN